MKSVSKIALMFVLSVVFLVAQDQKVKMINLEFHNSGEEGQDVNMSLPLTMLESVRPQIEKALTDLRDGKNQLDLAGMWSSIREAGPNQFLEIEKDNQHVTLSTTKTHLKVKVTTENNENIDVSLPLALCDSLFESTKDINFDKIMSAVLALEGQDLVVINSPTIKGRVWIQ